MSSQTISALIEEVDVAQLRRALNQLLRPHIEPVFGAAKIIEHEVAALNAMKVLGYINHGADEFDLVEKLRITRCKARSLLYQAALRGESSQADMDSALRKALESMRALRDGAMYLIEVPDPLTMDRLRKRVRDLGYLSDGTFSGSIAKIPEVALIRLVEDLIPEEGKEEIRKQLIEAGMSDMSLAGAIKAMLGKIGRRAFDEVGEQAGKALGEQVCEIFSCGWQAVGKFIKLSDK